VQYGVKGGGVPREKREREGKPHGRESSTSRTERRHQKKGTRGAGEDDAGFAAKEKAKGERDEISQIGDLSKRARRTHQACTGGGGEKGQPL